MASKRAATSKSNIFKAVHSYKEHVSICLSHVMPSEIEIDEVCQYHKEHVDVKVFLLMPCSWLAG